MWSPFFAFCFFIPFCAAYAHALLSEYRLFMFSTQIWRSLTIIHSNSCAGPPLCHVAFNISVISGFFGLTHVMIWLVTMAGTCSGKDVASHISDGFSRSFQHIAMLWTCFQCNERHWKTLIYHSPLACLAQTPGLEPRAKVLKPL